MSRSNGRNGPLTAASLTRKMKRESMIAGNSLENSYVANTRQGTANVNSGNRRIRLQTLSNKQGVTVQLSSQLQTLGRNDPFNTTNPLVESQETTYNELDLPEQMKGLTHIGFEREKQKL